MSFSLNRILKLGMVVCNLLAEAIIQSNQFKIIFYGVLVKDRHGCQVYN